jgi:hypothetical protein
MSCNVSLYIVKRVLKAMTVKHLFLPGHSVYEMRRANVYLYGIQQYGRSTGTFGSVYIADEQEDRPSV